MLLVAVDTFLKEYVKNNENNTINVQDLETAEREDVEYSRCKNVVPYDFSNNNNNGDNTIVALWGDEYGWTVEYYPVNSIKIENNDAIVEYESGDIVSHPINGMADFVHIEGPVEVPFAYILKDNFNPHIIDEEKDDELNENVS